MKQSTFKKRKEYYKLQTFLIRKEKEIKIRGETWTSINNVKRKKAQRMLIEMKIETFKKCKFRAIA